MNPLPSETPQCIQDQGSWCYQVFQVTHNEWLAASAAWLVAKPLTILLILVCAFLIRLIVRKIIDRITSIPRNNNRKLPALLRPLRERAPGLLGPSLTERRAQRAKTIGSVLKSVTTFVVYGLAFMHATSWMFGST